MESIYTILRHSCNLAVNFEVFLSHRHILYICTKFRAPTPSQRDLFSELCFATWDVNTGSPVQAIQLEISAPKHVGATGEDVPPYILC